MAVQRGRYSDVVSMWNAMNRLMDEAFLRTRGPSGGDALEIPIDLYDAGEEYVLRAMVPGATADEVQVTMLGENVQIRGVIHMHQAEPERDASWLVHEIPHGTFSRVVTLPQRADAERASASFENGIVTLRLPKATEHRPQPIKITTR
ncbi:MAG: Hsp20/alpha crystallin family protein [Chloroflexi bacterium]|nr:Hsp20/alpha crystallin family protein [Chloroflexota bacterium]MCL4543408.1 Hsp20/alpha crystallin family protein [Chloroflexota bacterium]